MTTRLRLSPTHFNPPDPQAPALKPIGRWLPANRGFYDAFRTWLRQGGYGHTTLAAYSLSARVALGLLDQAYWLIDPTTDLDRVRD